MADETTLITQPDAPPHESPPNTPDGQHQQPPADPPAADPPKAEPPVEVPPGAPESYADFTAPEGMELDKDLLGKFTPLAKELNLTQEQAQKLVDLQADQAQRWVQGQKEAIQAAQEQWVSEVKQDDEIGGAELNARLGVAKKALDAFGTPKLTELLNQSGLGNHPEVIRAFYRIGKGMSEDRLVTGGGASDGEKPMAHRLYPNDVPKR